MSTVQASTTCIDWKWDMLADIALRGSAAAWWLTTAAGMWIFAYYLLAYYVSPALFGGLVTWTDTKLVTGYIPGDVVGNSVVAAHIFVAVIIMVFGPFQLVPQIRKRWPVYHRLFGKIYMATVVVTALGGLYMTWVRDNPQANIIEHVGTSINALLVLLFSGIALRHALRRDIHRHRRWALRLFIVVGGSWFIRVGYGLWFLFPDYGPAALEAFSIFISYAQYLIPLAVLELYLLTQQHAGPHGRLAMAGGLVGATAVTGIGVYQVFLGMWLPRLL